MVFSNLLFDRNSVLKLNKKVNYNLCRKSLFSSLEIEHNILYTRWLKVNSSLNLCISFTCSVDKKYCSLSQNHLPLGIVSFFSLFTFYICPCSQYNWVNKNNWVAFVCLVVTSFEVGDLGSNPGKGWRISIYSGILIMASDHELESWTTL